MSAPEPPTEEPTRPSEIETEILAGRGREEAEGTAEQAPPEASSELSTEVLPDGSGPAGDATVVEAARALSEVGREILEPVDSILEDQATRMEGVRSLVRDLDSNYLRVTLAADGLAAVVLAGTVLLADLQDGWLYLAMEALIAIALLRYVRASVTRMRWRRWARGLTAVLLSGVWAWLIHHRIPPEPVWGGAALAVRGALPSLWVPVVMHAAVGVLVLLHLPLQRYLQPGWRRMARS